MIELDNHLHVKISRSQPHGRATDFELNGARLTDISRVTIEFSAKSLNMVTLTFPARVTTEEVD